MFFISNSQVLAGALRCQKYLETRLRECLFNRKTKFYAMRLLFALVPLGGLAQVQDGVLSAVAASGASVAGSYSIFPIGSHNIVWVASGHPAVDKGDKAYTDLPCYWIQVINLNTDQVVAQSFAPWPAPAIAKNMGLFQAFQKGTLYYTGTINRGDVLQVNSGALLVKCDSSFTADKIASDKNGAIAASYGSFSYTVTVDPALLRRLGLKRYLHRMNLIGEPVDATTGAFYENQTDLHVNGPLPIEVKRTYSSLNTSVMNEFGYGWQAGYSSYLVPSDDLTTIDAADTDGSVLTFRQQGTSGIWAPSVADNPSLANTSGGMVNLLNSTIVLTSPDNYQWRMPDGSVRSYVVQAFPATGDDGTVYPRQLPYLSLLVDNRGNSLTYAYGTDSTVGDYGRINFIQSSNGSSVSFAYDSEQRITQAAASDGRQVNYSYSVSGDLVSVQRPDGSVFSYQYGADNKNSPTHLISQATNPGGRVLQNVFDASGRVIQQLATVSQVNPTALVTTATYDYSVAGQTTVSDAYNHRTVYQYTSGGLMTKFTDPLLQSTTQVWHTSTDSSGAYINSLQSVTDKRGLVTSYKYDSRGNITQTQVTGHLTGDPTTVQAATSSAAYNTLSLPTSVTNASGITTNYSYTDPFYHYLPTQISTFKGTIPLRTDILVYTAVGTSKGLLASKTLAAGSADQSVTSFSYNSGGFLIQQTAKTGTSDPDVVTNFAYNNRGEVIRTTDADGRSTEFTYDAMSRQLSRIVKDETGSILGLWTKSYTGNGELSQTIGTRTFPQDSIVYSYDGAGRLEEQVATRSQALSSGSGVTLAPNAITSFGYDYVGNLILRVDPQGNSTTMAYDAAGQLVTKIASSLRTEAYQYEPGGKTSQYVSPLGGITNSFYTSTGSLRRQENPDGSVLQWTYYIDGRLQTEVLRNGSYWTTVYDDVSHTVTRTFTSSAGGVLAAETSVFDLRGNLIKFTDGENFLRSISFDGLDRKKVVTGAPAVSGSAQRVTTYIYGASGKTATILNGLEEQTATTFDALGRPQKTRVLDVGGAVVRTTTYTYSTGHNAVMVTEGTGANAVSRTTWTDTADRPVLTVLGDGTFTQTQYDSNGNVLSVTDALGQTTNYSYNALDQKISETLPDGSITVFTCDSAGNPLTRAMANGALTYQQSYDTAGRKISEQLYSGSAASRQFSYVYYSAGTASVGLLQTVTAPRDTVTTVYDPFLRPQTVSTSGSLPETNSTTIYSYDRRNLVTAISQSSMSTLGVTGTLISRTYDGYGQLVTEIVTAGGTSYANVTQTWDAAGRRSSLNEASSTLPAPLFSWQRRADGLLSKATANGVDYTFGYADSGLLSSRANPFRSLVVDSRDAVGRVIQQSQTVGGSSVLVENMTWRINSTLGSYAANHTGTGAWNEFRPYTYNNRGQLLSEGFSPAAGATSAFGYTFDGNNPGLGVRLDAKIGTGAPASWETVATVNSLGRVTTDNDVGGTAGAVGRSVLASGVAVGADHVDILVDGVSQGRASYPSGSAWSMSLDLAAGSHVLTANAVDSSGLYIATSSSTFTVTAASAGDTGGSVTSTFDGDGNVTSRTWTSGLSQTLTWDPFGRLIEVAQRDSANNGYDWTALYDGLGRRLKTAQQPVVNNNATGAATNLVSIFDPQVEFLEIGVAVNAAKAWKVYGPDLNGGYGGLQGTGGVEATIVDVTKVTKGVINDQFGNGVASINGGTVAWLVTRVGGYGPLPGNVVENLTDISRVAEATAWRGRRIDASGFYNLGARYYEPTSGRFLSADPAGHASSPSLYDFCDGDPVNSFDSDGRCVGTATGADWSRDAINNALLVYQKGLGDQTVRLGDALQNLLFREVVSRAMRAGGDGVDTEHALRFLETENVRARTLNDPIMLNGAGVQLLIDANQKFGEVSAFDRFMAKGGSDIIAGLTVFGAGLAGESGGAQVAAESGETALLRGHLDNAIARFEAEGYTAEQAASLAENPGLAAAHRGTQIDAFFKESVSLDSQLSHLELTPRYKFGPDVFNPSNQTWWDVTTPAQWQTHVEKYWLFGDGTPLFTK